MNKANLIIFIDQPLTRWNFDRLELNEIQSCSNITVFDLKRLVFPKRGFAVQDGFPHIKLKEIYTWRDFFKCLREIKNCDYFISWLGNYGANNFLIYLFFQKHCHKWIFLTISSFPPPTSASRLMSLIGRLKRRRGKGLSLRGVMNRFFSFMFLPAFRNKPKYFLCAGSHVRRSYQNCYSNDTIMVNSLSYDYRQYKEFTSDFHSASLYLLFIDQFLYAHPDSADNGLSPKDEPAYHQVLKSFFDKVEEYFELPIVIAAHPRASAEYNRHLEAELCREVVSDNTLKSISKAALCIGHSSTAFGWAAFMQKPVLFITTAELDKKHRDTYDLARQFSTLPYSIDGECEIGDIQAHISKIDGGSNYIANFHGNAESERLVSLSEFVRGL